MHFIEPCSTLRKNLDCFSFSMTFTAVHLICEDGSILKSFILCLCNIFFSVNFQKSGSRDSTFIPFLLLLLSSDIYYLVIYVYCSFLYALIIAMSITVMMNMIITIFPN